MSGAETLTRCCVPTVALQWLSAIPGSVDEKAYRFVDGVLVEHGCRVCLVVEDFEE